MWCCIKIIPVWRKPYEPGRSRILHRCPEERRSPSESQAGQAGGNIRLNNKGEEIITRKNIHTIDWSGNAYYAGSVETSKVILGTEKTNFTGSYDELKNKPQTDKTLTQTNKFADAKTVGDKLATKLDKTSIENKTADDIIPVHKDTDGKLYTASSVYVGSTEPPADSKAVIWITPNGIFKYKNEQGSWEEISIAKGQDGHTPVKGTDYWTEADKQEIVNDVLAQIPASEGVAF